jgi:hypothetical protein
MALARRGYEDHPPRMDDSMPRMGGTGMAHFSSPPAWEEFLSEAKGVVAAFDVLRTEQ